MRSASAVADPVTQDPTEPSDVPRAVVRRGPSWPSWLIWLVPVVALAFFMTLTNLFSEDKYDPATFQNRKNLFQNRNVMAIVLEVPNEMLGDGEIGVWATISLFGPAVFK